MMGLGLGLGLHRNQVFDGTAIAIDFRGMSTGSTPSDFTFTRSTAATYWDAEGMLKWAPHNLHINSEDISDAGWSAENIASRTADTFLETTATGLHRISAASSFAITSGAAALVRAEVKAVGSRRLSLNVNALLGSAALFDLTGSGSLVSISGTSSGLGAEISLLSDGWYRVTVFGVGTGSANRVYFQSQLSSEATAAGSSFTGDAASGMQVRMVQVNYGPTALLYMPTTSAARYDSMRISRDPVSGEMGYLAEPQRTNLVFNSLFAGGSPPTSWSMTGTYSVGASNVATAVGGYAVTFNPTASTSFAAQNITLATNTTYTASFIVEGAPTGSLTIADVHLLGALPSGCAIISYTLNGAVALSSTAITGSCTVGVIFGGTYTGGTAYQRVGVVNIKTASITISCPQVEAGTYHSSRIPTTTATVTRGADLLTHTLSGANATALSTAGTMVCRFSFLGGDSSADANARFACNLDNGTAANHIRIYNVSGSVGTYANGTATMDITPAGGTVAANTPTKVAVAYAINDGAACRNGGVVATDATVDVPAVTQIGIGGNSYNGAQKLGGLIHSFSLYTSRLTDAQLQALTA